MGAADPTRVAVRRWVEERGFGDSDADVLLTLIDRLVEERRSPGPEPRGPDLTERYRDLGRIARGGSGDVRRAKDSVLDRLVAMKLIRWDHLGSDAHERRFRNEARITAFLEHPGIVPVYDRGVRPDGRMWFTMRRVAGRTFDRVIAAVHAGDDGERWTVRRLVEAFLRVCETVAFAHSRGVVHRDLKPQNMMIGPFGEVLVMDWGIARVIDEPDDLLDTGAFPREALGHETEEGDILGTLGYMAPEQARGEATRIGPHSDVYALGLILYEILTGTTARRGTARALRDQAQQPPPLVLPASAGFTAPDELAAICIKAADALIERRYADAGELADDVRSWLEGEVRRARALGIVERAREMESELELLRANERELRARAAGILAGLQPFDPVERKVPGWEIEDRADHAAAERVRLETEWLETLRTALQHDPELDRAHEMLAEHYREALLEAEARQSTANAVTYEALVRRHDRGHHRELLSGRGTLSLTTDPAGARVSLFRYELVNRRLVARTREELGVTPIANASLPIGSYLLVLEAPGRAIVRYPVRIARGAHWDPRRPGDTEPTPIRLPDAAEIDESEVFVPGGWFTAGGDELAAEPVSRRLVWVDDFALGRFPVTNAEYLEFLNDLIDRGDETSALRSVPRQPRGAHRETADWVAFPRGANGRFELSTDESGNPVLPDWPVALVDWRSANAFLRWKSGRSGKSYRLPNELEWEKAARGVDERVFPWGNQPESTWARILGSTAATPTRAAVDSYPIDESPYGVRGLAGNVRDWCINVWRHEGPPAPGGILDIDAAAHDDPELRVLRGGCWSTVPLYARAAGRFGGPPDERFSLLGFRWARNLRPRVAQNIAE